jgi:tetratricopeptide (TPR) repeat protein
MDAQILQVLTEIRWLVSVVAVIAAVIAVTFVVSVMVTYRHNLQNLKSGDFFAQGNALLNSGKLNELVDLCDKHLIDLPADASAHWLKANAHYRRKEWHQALISYRKADELQPGWSLEPVIAEIEEKVAKGGKSPELKVVAPVAAPIDGGVSAHEGPPRSADA